MMPRRLVSHGLSDAPSQYALIDNARRARLGLSRDAYAAAMGELFEPFTRVAAANPHAAAPQARTARELITPTEANRPIADPYPRYLVAREKVNQGAAVLLMSLAAARRLGVPDDRRVFLHGHADVRERDLMERADLSRSPAAVLAVSRALDLAGITATDLDSHRPLQLLPRPGLQHLRRPGAGGRRQARPHRDRRPAVLRRRGQQLLDARHRRDRGAGQGASRKRRPGRRERRHHEQVLRRRLLGHPGPLAAR